MFSGNLHKTTETRILKMFSIFLKEINSFLSSLVGYVAITVFLIITGLIIWIFPGNANILEYGYATLDSFFELAPMVFMFLVPAITMRSFSEEISSGTIELLGTKPISETSIILGKFFGALALICIALFPTGIYVYSISHLAVPAGEIDSGAILGSYVGLVLIASTFVAVGLFASSLTSNQIIAFVSGIFFCFFSFYAFDALSGLSEFSGKLDYFIRSLGVNAHYTSISKGVLDTRDMLYFVIVIALFLLGTRTVLESRKW